MANSFQSQEVAAPVSVVRQRWLPGLRQYRFPVLVAMLLGTLLLGAQILLFGQLHPQPYELAIGEWPDQLFVSGFYAREGDDEATYRWSTEGSQVLLRQVGTSAGTQLTLRLGERPRSIAAQQLALWCGERECARFAVEQRPRSYRVLLPRWGLAGGNLDLGLHSELFSTAKDPRRLGVRLDHLSLAFAASQPLLPAPRQVLGQFALLLLCALTLCRLHWRPGLVVAALALLALGLLFVYSQYLLLLDRYMLRLLLAAGLLAALAWWLPTRLARSLPWIGDTAFGAQLTTLLVLACALRLSGALLPVFGAHDLPRNISRFLLVHDGSLVIIARSAEFGGGFTIYPPAPYVALLPLGLLTANVGLIVQGGLALLDGTSALLVALLALHLGTSRRAALLAGLLYAGLPIAVTALWWGFSAQIFGQWLMVPLTLLLLWSEQRRAAWPLLLGGVLLTMALLSHIGVAVLAVAWLGLAWLGLLFSRWASWRLRLAALAVLAASCLLGFVLIYLDVAGLKLRELLAIGGDVADEPFQASYSLIWKGLLIAFAPLGPALIALGLPVLARRMPPPAALLTWSWCLTALLFFAIEYVSGLQARYIYFFMPIGCVAMAVLLDRLAARGLLGRGVTWGLAVLLALQGALLWYSGTFEALKLSITPLSH